MTQPNLEVVGVRAVVEGFDKYVRQTAQIQKSTTKMSRGVQTAGKQAQSAGTSFRSFGRDAAIVGSGLFGVGLGLGSVSLAFTNTVGAAIGFESAFAGVRKTVEGTDQELATLEVGFRNLARVMPNTAIELAGIGEAAGQLGIATGSILGFVETMAMLGETTNLSSQEAATALARLANITQLPQDQFDELGSTIVDLGNNFATTEAEIVTFGLRIAGAGTQIGLSEPEILAFGAALSSVGIQAEAGGTAISRVFVEIDKAVREGGDALEAFASVAGITAEEFATAYGDDAAGAIATFIEGLGGIKDSGGDVFAVLEDLELGNQRVRDALLRASGAGDLLRDSLDRSKTAFAENTALQVEFAQRVDTSAAKFAILRNNLNDIGITLGEVMLPVLVEGTSRLLTFIDTLRFVGSVGQGAFDALDQSLTDFANSTGVAGLDVTAKKLGALALAFGTFGVGVGAIAGVELFGSKVTGAFGGITNAIGLTDKSVNDFASSFEGSVARMQQTIGNLQFIREQQEQKVLDSAIKAAPDLGLLLSQSLDRFDPKPAEVAGEKAANSFGSGFASVIDQVTNTAEGAIAAFTGVVASSAASRRLEEQFGATGARVATAFLDAVTTPTAQGGEQLGRALEEMFKQAEAAGVPLSEEAGRSLMDALAFGIDSGSPEATQAALDALMGVTDAFNQGAETMVDIFRGTVADIAQDTALDELFGQKGSDLFDALTEGMETGSQQSIASAARQADAIRKILSETLSQEQGQALGLALMTALERALVDGGGQALTAVRAILAEINSALAGVSGFTGEADATGRQQQVGSINPTEFNADLKALARELGLSPVPSELRRLAQILASGRTPRIETLPLRGGGVQRRLTSTPGPAQPRASVATAPVASAVAPQSVAQSRSETGGRGVNGDTNVTVDLTGSQFNGSPDENGEAIVRSFEDILNREQTARAFQAGV